MQRAELALGGLRSTKPRLGEPRRTLPLSGRGRGDDSGHPGAVSHSGEGTYATKRHRWVFTRPRGLFHRRGNRLVEMVHAPVKARFDAVVALRVEGVSISAIARVEGIAWNTVARWLEDAADVCRGFNQRRMRG